MTPDLPESLPEGVQAEKCCPPGQCSRCDEIWWTVRVCLHLVAIDRGDAPAGTSQQDLAAFADGGAG